jgi:hypothetical protein
MSGLSFEQVRIPAALILIIVAAFIFVPRGEGQPAAAVATATPAIVVGQPGGGVTSTASATAVPTLTPAPTPTATATPVPTPQPVADSFSARVLACRDINGSRCRGELGTLPARAGSFTALVLFTDAAAGDAINVVLSGPGGTITGGPYTLGGGGDGYYYSTFTVGGLPAGDYVVTAYRNGQAVGETSFRRAG